MKQKETKEDKKRQKETTKETKRRRQKETKGDKRRHNLPRSFKIFY